VWYGENASGGKRERRDELQECSRRSTRPVLRVVWLWQSALCWTALCVDLSAKPCTRLRISNPMYSCHRVQSSNHPVLNRQCWGNVRPSPGQSVNYISVRYPAVSSRGAHRL
jgi:hypothetical protein